MDINLYAQRAKFKSLPPDFNHQEGEKYDSSYEYAKSMSTYHHDKWKMDAPNEWWHRLGRFEGNFGESVDKIIAKSQDLSWDDITRKGLRPGFKGGQTPMDEQERNDRKKHGVDQVEYTQVVLEDFIDTLPDIKAIVDYWQLADVTYRVHVQMPGQTFAPHIDKLWHRCPEDPTRIVRVTVNLADYDPGQIMMFGSQFYSHWHAGDVFIFDHFNVPHATINVSTQPRPNMVITGLRTPEFDAIITRHDENTRMKI